MSRVERGRRVARYLTGHTGIPNLRYEFGQGILAPYPYLIQVTSATAGWRFFQDIAEMPEDRIGMVIRNDAFLESIDSSVVGIKLHAFCKLMEAHYKTIEDRINPE
jgi:hypothetical protein